MIGSRHPGVMRTLPNKRKKEDKAGEEGNAF